MPDEEFGEWVDLHGREPFGVPVEHDNWATLLSYMHALLCVSLEIRAMTGGKDAPRSQAKVEKEDFNRSRTGAIVSQLDDVLNRDKKLTEEDHKEIADRFASERDLFKQHFNK